MDSAPIAARLGPRSHGALAWARALLASAGLAVAASLTSPAPVAALTCSTTTGLPTVTRPGTVIVRDSFESGSVRTKWAVTDDGDAWAGITTAAPKRGLCAGRLTVTSSATSRANLRHALPTGTSDVWSVGWFRVDKQGWVGSNVPTFRFFNGTARVVDVFRANGTGIMWLRTRSGSGTWTFHRLGTFIPLHSWFKVEVHVRTNWRASTVSVYINGSRRYASSSYYLPAGHLTKVMIGAEHVRQVCDLSFDDIVVTAP
jgi:hypothetical protein